MDWRVDVLSGRPGNEHALVHIASTKAARMAARGMGIELGEGEREGEGSLRETGV